MCEGPTREKRGEPAKNWHFLYPKMSRNGGDFINFSSRGKKGKEGLSTFISLLVSLFG